MPAKIAEDRTQAHHIVEVRHHIIGVVVVAVDGSLRQHDAGHTAYGEEEEEPEGPEHGCFELHQSRPTWSQSN